MAVELSTLVEQVSHMDFKLVAGEKGLSNVVRWTHMVDTTEISEFLEGGEVAFTTGLGLSEELDLLQLVKGVHKNGASAIVINIGPYIESISQEVIDFGNKHDFPIFEVPWKVHMAEIMRIFCFTITKSEQNNKEIESAFRNAIFCPKQEELYVGSLMQKGFLANWNYCVAVLNIMKNEKSVDESRLEKLKVRLESHIQHFYKKCVVIRLEDYMVIIMGDCTRERVETCMKDICRHMSSYMSASESAYYGVGKVTRSIRCVFKSYSQAIKISKIQKREEAQDNLMFYHDIGIYKLLMSIDDKEIIEDYFNDTINPLLEYDRLNQTDLSDVLKCYIKHSGSVKETSEELFVHRNTINYKINKIEEILNVDLSNLDTRLQLNIGFMLKNLVNL